VKYFNRALLAVKLREVIPSVLLIGQLSRSYSRQGIHLDLRRLEIISSDVDLPILPKIALIVRKNACFACCKEHLKIRDRIMKTSRLW